MERTKPAKPLGIKAYGSIPHLIGSNRGPADKGVNEGQHRICTEKCRKGDWILIQEKLDGSCCSVAKHDGEIIALQRGGYPAESSPYEQHHMFAKWVQGNRDKFDSLLENGERCVGEWLAQAHGTIYEIDSDPYVVFDIMRGSARQIFYDVATRTREAGLICPRTHCEKAAIPIDEAMDIFRRLRMFRSPRPPEGVIYRVESNRKVDFLAKFVRNDFVPGKYLPEISGADPVWNYRLADT